MLYLILLPLYLAANAYFFYEFCVWIDAVMKLARSERRKHLALAIKLTFIILYSFCALSLLLAFAIPDSAAESSVFLFKLRRFLKLVGNYHEGVLLYLGLAFVVVWLLKLLRLLILKCLKRSPKPVTVRHAVAGILFFAAVIAVTACGVYGARKIHVTHYEVDVDKSLGSAGKAAGQTEETAGQTEEAAGQAGDSDGLRIVLISDLHLGYNIGVKHLEKTVKLINEQKPDVVLIAGDIFDNEYSALEDPEALENLFLSIESRYGVYACYGNHDIEEAILGGFTFGGKAGKTNSEEMNEFLEKSGIVLLKDEYVLIDDSFYIYGRPDYSRPGTDSESRKTPAEITAELDTSKLIIVLDHQPKELEELAAAGVDLDFCGHTHDGQLFPLNLLQKFLWENSCGYLKVADMHNIVTSGVGLFGPNMRVGTKAEICVIDVK